MVVSNTDLHNHSLVASSPHAADLDAICSAGSARKIDAFFTRNPRRGYHSDSYVSFKAKAFTSFKIKF